jgi:prephenate dehydrogenase
MFKKISIIGVGLIGGSIGLAVKKNNLAQEVIGTTSRKTTLQKALKVKAIDRGTLSLSKCVNDADLVILAVPIDEIERILKTIKPFLKKGCVVTDIASTKQRIIKMANEVLGKDAHFIGTHPMAGSEKRGVEYASADLFKKSILIATPTAKTNKAKLNKLKSFWQKLGAKVIIMSSRKHDETAAAISHLPHALAVSLMNVVSPGDLKFSAGGFKDVTRIAKSSEIIWQGIFESNSKEVSKKIDQFIKELTAFKKVLSNKTALKVKLKRAKNKRWRI